ncbi:hypothetical protein [Plantactinospora sp. B5E13]|uniref:hypothetical protein n=1 Tax=Plantactinospora sp. B5E13 TaxID=3153758 RepID=UPI00325F629C
MKRTFATLAALLVTFGVALFATASPASAHTGNPPSGCHYTNFFTGGGTNYGRACFEWEGDDHWVADLQGNGRRVGVDIQTNYGKYRNCENTHGAGTWHECTFDHLEEECVRWRGYEYDGDTGSFYNITPWSSWRRIDTGGAC